MIRLIKRIFKRIFRRKQEIEIRPEFVPLATNSKRILELAQPCMLFEKFGRGGVPEYKWYIRLWRWVQGIKDEPILPPNRGKTIKFRRYEPLGPRVSLGYVYGGLRYDEDPGIMAWKIKTYGQN